MDKKATLSALVIGVIIGCATSQATEIASANAEPTPAAAPAAPGQLRECMILELEADHDLKDADEKVRSLDGWTPVGGSNQGVVVCR
jgi:hypothetical protein